MAHAGGGLMSVEICPTAADAGARASSLIAEALRAAVAERGRGVAALSGGRAPGAMLRALAAADLPWPEIHIFQVDERIVDADDERRNLKGIRAALADSQLPAENLHGMPVESQPPEAGAARYYADLCAAAGTPPRVDVVHLGLGEDGHTASLAPDDVVLDADNDVAITGLYNGVHRMTLTLPALDRARCLIWLVTGASKRDVVGRFLAGDTALVASRVRREAAVIVLDNDSADE